jgi:NAD(P)-dependent dehydrogenase (short-subunit alcohol dehydrogenase family)
MDVADEHAVQAAVQQAQARFGPVNILVNNAGQASSQPFAKTDAALWQQMLNVNLTGTYHCIQAVLPGMLEAAKAGTPGRIVNIASTAGLKGYAYVSAYVAAKHGVVGLTKALALELARKGVTVNAICPGYTETDIVREAVQNIVGKTGKSEDQARQARDIRSAAWVRAAYRSAQQQYRRHFRGHVLAPRLFGLALRLRRQLHRRHWLDRAEPRSRR